MLVTARHQPHVTLDPEEAGAEITINEETGGAGERGVGRRKFLPVGQKMKE